MESGLQALKTKQRMTEWGEIITACRNSGQSVRKWCEDNQVNEKTYYYWQSKLFKKLTAEACFVEIPAATSRAVAATVRFGDKSADIYIGADSKTVEAVCQALKGC